MPKIGDERWIVERIDTRAVEALARENGWDGGEGLRESCEPEDVAVHSVHASLETATAAAKAWLATGRSFYGCSIIDHQVFEQWHDDRGNSVKHASWETQRSYEVAMDGDRIPVDA